MYLPARLLKFLFIGLVSLTGLAACGPMYVHDRHYEPYPVQPYYGAPTYTGRPVVVVPRVIVPQPQNHYFPHGLDRHPGRHDSDKRPPQAHRPDPAHRNPGHDHFSNGMRDDGHGRPTGQPDGRNHNKPKDKGD
jgi:hypothetical protein